MAISLIVITKGDSDVVLLQPFGEFQAVDFLLDQERVGNTRSGLQNLTTNFVERIII